MNNDIYLTERIGKINFCGKKEEWSQAGSPGMEEKVPSSRRTTFESDLDNGLQQSDPMASSYEKLIS